MGTFNQLPPANDDTPSPAVKIWISRGQAESLERHLAADDTRRWALVLREIRKALNRDANGKTYPWQKEEKR